MEDAGKISAIGRAQSGDRIQSRRHHHHRQRELPDTVLATRLGEIQGKHHSDVRGARRARQRRLSGILGRSSTAANSRSAEYKRFGKGGKEVWILASYNPILDDTGKPFKVVKFASDVTASKTDSGRFRRADRGDRQVAGGDRVQHGRPSC